MCGGGGDPIKIIRLILIITLIFPFTYSGELRNGSLEICKGVV